MVEPKDPETTLCVRTASKSAPTAPPTRALPNPEWLLKDKLLYHKFDYRKRRNPDVEKDWQEYLAEGNEEEQKRFVSGVVGESKTTKKRKTHINTSGNKTKSGWETFHEAQQRDGYELTLECMRAGTLSSERNPSLPDPAVSQIKFTWAN